MPQEHVSPEERLLRLIRQNKTVAPQAAAAGKRGPAAESVALSGFSGEGFFAVIDKFLIFVSIGLCVYIAFEFFFFKRDVKMAMQNLPAGNERGISEEIKAASPKPYSFYAQQIEQRDIFESPLYQNPNKSDNTPAVFSSMPELTKNLKLVGIILQEGGSEAVIEDLESQQTFFLKKGDNLKSAVVDDIQKSKVILLFNNQKVELVQ